MTRLMFPIGAPVYCEDGEVRGKLTHVVTHATSRRVTDLIVTSGFPLVKSEARVVPIAAVNETTEHAVSLSMSTEALATCAAYEEAFLEVEIPSAGTVPAFDPTQGGYGTAPVSPAPPSQHLHLRRARYQQVMGQQTQVRTLHGLVGHLARLWVDQASTAMTHVVARKGFIWVEYTTIPVELIEEMSGAEILLAASHREIEELPQHPV